MKTVFPAHAVKMGERQAFQEIKRPRSTTESEEYFGMNKKIPLVFTCALMLSPVAGCAKTPDIEEPPVLNYTAPQDGEEIIVIKVKDYGEIRIKLFDDLLPEACENFRTLAKDGYYDELIFHRVMENFMIQGGDPKGNGTGGESCWGGKFNGGVSDQIIHVPGVVAYANSAGPSTDGSQFYIVTGDAVSSEYLDQLETKGMHFSDEARELYEKYGGTPWLDGGYTAFGQVIDGLDIVYKISHVDTDGDDKPKESVYIESVTTEQYEGGAIRWYPTDYEGLE